MTEQWIEIGIWSILSTGLIWGYFRLFLGGSRRHSLHRFLLLLTPLLGPLCWLLPAKFEAEIGMGLTEITLPEVLISGGEGASGPELPLLAWVLIGGFTLRLSWTLWQMFSAWRLTRTGKRESAEGAVWVHTNADTPVSSFFRWIFWTESNDLSPEMRAQLRAHELCHVRQGHSWDLLFLELMSAVFWFNPFLWLIRKDLKNIHEYLADEAALSAGSRESYHQLILNWIFPGQAPALSHPFFSSTLKKRIQMMKNAQNPLGSTGRYLLLVPMLALLFSVSLIRAQAPSANGPEDLVELDEKPKILNLNEVVAAIGYPKEASAAGIEGKEIVQVRFDKAGNYAEHKFVKTSNKIFSEAIEEHIADLKASPGKKDGKSVSVWLTIPFAFKLPPEEK